MITFDTQYDNVEAIGQAAKMANVKTKRNYNIVGLAQEESPPVGFHYNMDKFKSSEIEEELREFFKNSGLAIEFDHNPEIEGIMIGLRRDIRDNIKLSVALIKTIIYTLEGQLELDNQFKIDGINKFKMPENV